MLREILEQVPPSDKMQLMAAFNGGFSFQVKFEEYYIGVYQPARKNVEEKGAWSIWKK